MDDEQLDIINKQYIASVKTSEKIVGNYIDLDITIKNIKIPTDLNQILIDIGNIVQKEIKK